MGRQENLQVFLDTEKHVKNNKVLSEAVKYSGSHQIVIPEYMSLSDMMPITNGTEIKWYVYIISHQQQILAVVLRKEVLHRKNACVDVPHYISI